MTISRSPVLSEILNAALEGKGADIRVALPARVETYYPDTQLVDVKPLLKDTIEDESGNVLDESLSIISNVPLCFPGAGGMRITFPVRAGDTVLLVFADRSLDLWLNQGGEVSPLESRRHNLSDAIAIPGLHPNNAAWSDADTSVITIGSDSGSADFAATAQRTLSELNKLKTAFDGHTHVFTPTGVTPGVGAGTPGVTGAGPTSAALSAPASGTVKIKG